MSNTDNMIDTFQNEWISRKLVYDRLDMKFNTVLGDILELSVKVLKDNGTIFFCGNGGSAAEAQHMAGEFQVRLSKNINRPPLKGVALTVDSSVITATANDFNFNEIFSRQLTALGTKNDMLVALTTSGNSDNIYKALETAVEMGIHTVLLCGSGIKNRNQLESLCTLILEVPSHDTAVIQEIHLSVGHTIIKYIENIIFHSTE